VSSTTISALHLRRGDTIGGKRIVEVVHGPLDGYHCVMTSVTLVGDEDGSAQPQTGMTIASTCGVEVSLPRPPKIKKERKHRAPKQKVSHESD